MSNKQRGLQAVLIFVLSTILISACTQSLSQAPLATPTLLPTGLFVSPFPSVENPMAMIEEFARQTAAAQTAAAGGGRTGTPGTPQTITTGTTSTPQAGGSITPTAGTPTNANAVATTPAVVSTTVTSGGSTSTPIPAGVRPASYTLQPGEFPYCIARRFNVDPDQLLSLSGLTAGQANNLPSGTLLKIPQSGAFPGDRALASHPTTYTVSSSDETVFSVACKYGDVDPAVLASTNGISVSADLSVGQQLKIP